jgi:hypothetical protein
MEQRLKIDPNHARELPRGQAYIITEGRMTKAQILRAPDLSAPLPVPEHTARSTSLPDVQSPTPTPQTAGASDGLPY